MITDNCLVLSMNRCRSTFSTFFTRTGVLYSLFARLSAMGAELNFPGAWDTRSSEETHSPLEDLLLEVRSHHLLRLS